jgi:hypothetical protein
MQKTIFINYNENFEKRKKYRQFKPHPSIPVLFDVIPSHQEASLGSSMLSQHRSSLSK